MSRTNFRWIAVFILCAASMLNAADITVVKSGSDKSRIDLSAFSGTGKAGALFKSTLENDLKLSGWFLISAPGQGVLLAAGSANDSGAQVNVSISVRSRAGKTYLSSRYRSDDARRLAHRVADEIVKAVKGVKGIASTRLVMIGMRSGKQDLYVCDADGGNFMRITHDNAVCLSPDWSPDGMSVVYTSYFEGGPHAYLLNLTRKSRRKVSGFPGINAGGSFSPDGSRLAIALSKDGNPEIYTMVPGGAGLKRITTTRHASEASPVWAPDGRSIAYVSDRSGSPQVYVMDAAGGRDRRVSNIGRENVAPDWSVDGRLVWASRRGSNYELVVMDPRNGREVQLTGDGFDYEDPSWAPDGRHIACSRTGGYHSEVYLLDTLGDRPIRLTTISGEWHSPAWSPK